MGVLTKAGRYQIVSELGRGSMGIVYKGFDPIINRTVAIKTMLTEGLTPQEFQEYKARFQREAQAAGILAHPNIITIYDFGEDEGILYLAMEFLEGKSLEKVVQEQTVLPLETLLPIFDQVCSALDHAHASKIVHRDIKPANIMILNNGTVKVTDFGIAKMLSTGMTQAGQILGTPNYMSPEQVKGKQIDGRSDIFSLGVILYELVTGEKPFFGQNITTVIYKIVNENPVSPRELDSTIHTGLSYVISKSLAKSPDERYQTCRELADDLKNYRKLGDMAAPSATVILKAPPAIDMEATSRLQVQEETKAPPPPIEPIAQPPVEERAVAAPSPFEEPAAPPAPPPAPVETVKPYAKPVSPRRAIPPTAPAQRRAASPAIWIILAVVVLGALGGSGYFFFVRGNQPSQTTQMPAPAEATQPPAGAPPAEASAPTPSGGTTNQVTQPLETTPPLTQAKTSTKSQEALPKPKPPRQEVAAAPAGKPPASALPAASTPAPEVGQLVVRSNVSGAKIIVDGNTEPSWVTPYTFAKLPSGTHTVVVSKDGYESFLRTVTVEGGQSSNLNASLTAAGGEVNIITVPAGLEILIDGKSYGPSPVKTSIPVGEHTYTVRQNGNAIYNGKFQMRGGAIITKKVEVGG